MRTKVTKTNSLRDLITLFLLLIAIVLMHLNTKAQFVGIGTNNPQRTLDVRGNHRFGGISHSIEFDSASGNISWTNSHLYLPVNQQLIQHSFSAEGLFYNNSQLEYRNQLGNVVFSTNWNNAIGYFGGNLGIGTVNPLAKIHVQDGATSVAPNYSNMILERNGNNHLDFYTPDNYESAILFQKPSHLQSGGIYYNSSVAPDGLIFRANNAPRMVINNNGYVGIGSNNPQSRLYIVDGFSGYAGGYYPGITFEGNGNRYINLLTPNTHESGLLFGNNIDAAAGGIVYNNYPSTVNGLQFRTNGNTTRMVIDQNGQVGIGNLDPVYLLDVNARMRIRSGGNNFNSAGIWLNNNSNGEAAFIGMEDDNHVGFFGNSAAGWQFTMNTQTGALKVNGSEGSAGQILQTGGPGTAPHWANKPYVILWANSSPMTLLGSGSINSLDIAGINNNTFTLAQTSTVVYSLSADFYANNCNICGGSYAYIPISITEPPNTSRSSMFVYANVTNQHTDTHSSTNSVVLGPGTYTVKATFDHPNSSSGEMYFGIGGIKLVIQVFPQ